MASSKHKVKLYVLSDATGITAERMTRAALVQFYKNVHAEIVRHAHLKTPAQLKRIIEEVQQEPGLVIYSLVDRKLRRIAERERGKNSLEMYDLLGPLLNRMARRFRASPSLHPGLMHLVGQESMRTASAIDFTLRHDDGAGEEDLGRADLIILGVSRTSKTPTSLYLSCNHGLMVANVPIVRGMDPPSKIFTLKRPRKVGLVISPEVLAAIRRDRYQGRVVPGYTDARDVSRELAYSHEIYDLLKGIKIVDVTHLPIEEVAGRILRRTGLA